MMQWGTLALILAAQADLPSPLERVRPGVPPAPQGECLGVLVGSAQQVAKRRGFSATRVRDLDFRVLLPRAPVGQHLLELKLYTPRGHLYQVLTVPFARAPQTARDEPPTPRRVTLPGHAQAVEVRVPTAVRTAAGRASAVAASLPVAGTWIVTNSLYGTWWAEAHLDGATRACAGARFQIVP